MTNGSITATTQITLAGLKVRTGDLIFTTDGGPSSLEGQFWRILGALIPGDVDHVVIYLGPGGRCVEAGAKGKVITFEIPGSVWDMPAMLPQRGIQDTLYGVGDPVAGRGIDPAQEELIRLKAANYALEQAILGKPYNLNFLDSTTDRAFYCSQLAFMAYRPQGIDLNAEVLFPAIPATRSIVFPQDVWRSCKARRRPA